MKKLFLTLTMGVFVVLSANAQDKSANNGGTDNTGKPAGVNHNTVRTSKLKKIGNPDAGKDTTTTKPEVKKETPSAKAAPVKSKEIAPATKKGSGTMSTTQPIQRKELPASKLGKF